MQVLSIINLILGALFLMCYAFQLAYLFIPFIKKLPAHKEASLHRYCIIVCARNEENVISDLYESIRRQDYPAELIDVVLVADNCNDKTAEVGRALGMTVFERFNREQIGKGYALDYGLARAAETFGEDHFDAFIVFDADNILTENYVTEINKTFSDGYEVITCYRNSKNYGDSWLAAGSGMWFLRDSKYLNGSRMRIGACPQVSGTGFLFSNSIRKEYGGWPFHTMTEDYEFTCHSVIRGKKFGYCETARFYDEQVSTFAQSWNQRLRWCKGGLQSFVLFLKPLFRGLFSRNFISCYDMIMSIAPAYFLSIIATVVNAVGVAVILCTGHDVWQTLLPLVPILGGAYAFVFINGLITTVTEWRHIRASAFKKILYLFTFPFYMVTFIPAAFVAVFKKDISWKPIHHKSADSGMAEQMQQKDDK